MVDYTAILQKSDDPVDLDLRMEGIDLDSSIHQPGVDIKDHSISEVLAADEPNLPALLSDVRFFFFYFSSIVRYPCRLHHVYTQYVHVEKSSKTQVLLNQLQIGNIKHLGTAIFIAT